MTCVSHEYTNVKKHNVQDWVKDRSINTTYSLVFANGLCVLLGTEEVVALFFQREAILNFVLNALWHWWWCGIGHVLVVFVDQKMFVEILFDFFCLKERRFNEAMDVRLLDVHTKNSFFFASSVKYSTKLKHHPQTKKNNFHATSQAVVHTQSSSHIIHIHTQLLTTALT